MSEPVKSNLGNVPRILEAMGLDKATQDYVVAAQKDKTINPDELRSAELAVDLQKRGKPSVIAKDKDGKEIDLSKNADLSKATEFNKTLALTTQAGKIAAATEADFYLLRGDNSFTNLPAPYYKGQIPGANAVDAQQATANLAANMLKECAGNRGLISSLSHPIADMVALTKEIGQKDGANLSPEQVARLRHATEFFSYHLERFAPERKKEIDAYVAEVTKAVTQGCANSVEQLKGQTPDGTGSPAGGKERDREIKK
jgi:hypothetical protein